MPALSSVTAISPGPVLVDIENLPRSPGTSQQDKKWCVTVVSTYSVLEGVIITGHFRYFPTVFLRLTFHIYVFQKHKFDIWFST